MNHTNQKVVKRKKNAKKKKTCGCNSFFKEHGRSRKNL